MNFGSFAAGAADAGSEDIKARRKSALEIKMQSALLQEKADLEAKKFQREDMASPETTQTMGLFGGAEYPAGSQRSVKELGLLQRAGASKMAAINRGGKGDVALTDIVDSVIKNPELFDTLSARDKARAMRPLQERGFVYTGKPLGVDKERTLAQAVTANRAVDRILARATEHKDDFMKLYGPGGIGARELESDLIMLKDLVEKINTGAASNSKEDVAYRTMVRPLAAELIEDLTDGNGVDMGVLTYKLTNLRDHLSQLSANRASGVVTGQESIANPYKAGVPTSGNAKSASQLVEDAERIRLKNLSESEDARAAEWLNKKNQKP